jgi:hypothetical protein
LKTSWTLAFLAAVAFSSPAFSQAITNVVPDPWFTGSLIAPSPALPKAGLAEVEVYDIYTIDTGDYSNDGAHYSVSNKLSQMQVVALFDYALTDRLSIQTVPSISRQWTDQGSSHSVGWGDLPVELDTRVWDGNDKTGQPSVTIALGLIFPTGDYDRLGNLLDGVGSGAYLAKEGALLQSLFNTPGEHALRLRFYGNIYETLARASVEDASVYGTSEGFRGNATPGVSAILGCAAEYCFDQHWVGVLGLAQNLSAGFTLNGTDRMDNAVHVRGPNSATSSVLPAFEYNWSGSLGVIAGARITVAGRNSDSYVAPQVAVSMSF